MGGRTFHVVQSVPLSFIIVSLKIKFFFGRTEEHITLGIHDIAHLKTDAVNRVSHPRYFSKLQNSP